MLSRQHQIRTTIVTILSLSLIQQIFSIRENRNGYQMDILGVNDGFLIWRALFLFPQLFLISTMLRALSRCR